MSIGGKGGVSHTLQSGNNYEGSLIRVIPNMDAKQRCEVFIEY